ncbi:hypothetical protein BJX65DRAFT_156760 [Aspergillus insuetus]
MQDPCSFKVLRSLPLISKSSNALHQQQCEAVRVYPVSNSEQVGDLRSNAPIAWTSPPLKNLPTECSDRGQAASECKCGGVRVQELRGRGPFQVLYRRIRIYRICRQHQLLSRPPELEDHIILAVADWCLGAKMMQSARGKNEKEKKQTLNQDLTAVIRSIWLALLLK